MHDLFIYKKKKGLTTALFVFAEEVFSLGISEGTAGNQIDPYQHYNCHNQNYVGFPPFLSQVAQQTSFAGIAIVAELGLVIVPQIAVCISHWINWVQPQCWVHVAETTNCWRLTTSWLCHTRKRGNNIKSTPPNSVLICMPKLATITRDFIFCNKDKAMTLIVD